MFRNLLNILPIEFRLITAVFLFIGFQLLPSCGFQPTQPLNIDDARLPIFVSSLESLNRGLKRRLEQQQLSTHRITIAKSTIEFENISLTERDYSVSSDGRNAEYEMELQAIVIWRNADDSTASAKNPYLRSRVSAETTFLSNPLNPSAEAAERNRIRQFLEEQLVDQTLELLAINTGGDR